MRQALTEAGHQAVYVGGCVRDGLLGLPVKDADLATDASPDQVESLFPRSIAVGKSFGVIVVVLPDGSHVEVASFRSDAAYIDGRRPSAIHVADEAGDVQRRDFTINALVYDPAAGGVRDHVSGLADLDARILRVVGNAARLQEDRLRALRGLRFAAQLALTIEPATAAALRTTPLAGLSRERIWGEWDKAMQHPSRAVWWDLVIQHGHAAGILPLLAERRVPDVTAVLARLPAVSSPDLPLAALLHAAGLDVAVLEDEPLSRERVRRLRTLTECADPGIWRVADAVAQRRLLRQPLAAELIALWLAQDPELAVADLPARLAAEQAQSHVPLVTAKDLLASGWRPGPALGEALRRLEHAQLAGALPDRAAALAYAANMQEEQIGRRDPPTSGAPR